MGRTSNARKRLMAAAYELIWGDSYSTVTVEAVCERANVQKGTFYHFFDSKPDLVEAVIKEWWSERRLQMEKAFRHEIKPLERIWSYIDQVVQGQLQGYEKTGRITGAPLFLLASEICKKHEGLRLVLEDIIQSGVHFFEDAIREAQLSGEAKGEDPARIARLLWGFYAATLMRARIENNPELIRGLVADARELVELSSEATIGHQSYRRTMEREASWRATFTESSWPVADPDKMLVLTDTEGRVEWVNEAFTRACGYTQKELRGKKPGRLLQGAESDPAAVARLSNAVRSRHACDCQIVNYMKDGTPYRVFISLRPVFVQGKLDGFFAVEKVLPGGSHS